MKQSSQHMKLKDEKTMMILSWQQFSASLVQAVSALSHRLWSPVASSAPGEIDALSLLEYLLAPGSEPARAVFMYRQGQTKG